MAGWDKDSAGTLSLLTFRADETWYAAPAAEIARISLCTGPDTANVELSLLPGHAGRQGGIGLFIATGTREIGFMVDEVGAVTSLPTRFLHPVPDFLGGRCHRSLWGIGIDGERFYFLLNLSDAVEEEQVKEFTNIKEEKDV